MIAVKFHGTNAAGVPSDWPAETVEIAKAGDAPAGWTSMTDAQYASYVAARRASYDAWERSYQLAIAKADATAHVDAVAAHIAAVQNGTLRSRIAAATTVREVEEAAREP